MNKNVSMKPLTSLQSWVSCKILPDNNEGPITPDAIYCPGRVGHVAVCIRDELFVWGGYYQNEQWGTVYCKKAEVWVYSLDRDRWSRYFPRGAGSRHSSGSCSTMVWPYWYVLCGYLARGYTNIIWRLNMLTCTFESVRPQGDAISPRDKTVAWALDSRIFVLGGYGSVPLMCHIWDAEEDIYVREPMIEEDRGWLDQLAAFDTLTQTWALVETRGVSPLPRAAHSAVRVDMAVYIFGGRLAGVRMSDLHRLDLQSFTWSGALACNGDGPEGRSWHTMTRINEKNVILMGGYSDSNEILDDLWMLNVESLTWSLLQQHTQMPRLWHTACTNSMGDLLIFGGCTNNILDIASPMESSGDVLTVRLEPYSLERLSMHVLWKSRPGSWASWRSLPRNFRNWLEQREKAGWEMNRMIYRCQAYSMYGPSLTQLSVLQPGQADLINKSIVDIVELELEKQKDSQDKSTVDDSGIPYVQ
ncbi:hypothetical protein EGW08_002563 [Elysia chlorotica]|uniref:Uncharacterized protein n=1 Tax=Elysia chlorotica TaxID=188477 RepID=A0A433U751_ELYCH|nr:hypothetical protein EGW08_002563 [Elysia chlorotica]